MSLISIFSFLMLTDCWKVLCITTIQYEIVPKHDTKKLGLKQYCLYAPEQTTHTHLSHTHTRTHSYTLTHTGTETGSKQWDNLRQNILRPMQTPTPRGRTQAAKVVQPPCLACSVCHMTRVGWNYPETPDSDQMESNRTKEQIFYHHNMGVDVKTVPGCSEQIRLGWRTMVKLDQRK